MSRSVECLKKHEDLWMKFKDLNIINVCELCKKPAKQKCARCRDVFYCSKKCQLADWKRHGEYCNKNEFYIRWYFSQKGQPIDGTNEFFRSRFQEIFGGLDHDQYKKKFLKIIEFSTLPRDGLLYLLSNVVNGFMCLDALQKIGTLDKTEKKWLMVLEELKSFFSEYITENDFKYSDINENRAKSRDSLKVGHGDLLLKFKDLERTDVCAVCGIPTQSKCAGCEKVYYCGRKCQAKGWESHKKVCKRVDRR